MTIGMNAGERLEIGFGKVVEGQEQWMYGEYFPKFGPLFAQHGMKTMVSFVVLDSNVTDFSPAEGSLSSWPSAAHRQKLFQVEDFKNILPTRDSKLDLSDGHLFEPVSTGIELDEQGEYAIVIAAAGDSPTGALFSSPLAADSMNTVHQGRVISLHPWSPVCEELLTDYADRALVLRVRLNTPA